MNRVGTGRGDMKFRVGAVTNEITIDAATEAEALEIARSIPPSRWELVFEVFVVQPLDGTEGTSATQS